MINKLPAMFKTNLLSGIVIDYNIIYLNSSFLRTVAALDGSRSGLSEKFLIERPNLRNVQSKNPRRSMESIKCKGILFSLFFF